MEKQNAPFEEAVSLLADIPGFDRTTAWSVIAEIGIDMNQFPSANHLAALAGVCRGNNETGGKRLSGKTRKGSRWLRQELWESAGAPPVVKTVTSLPFSGASPPIGAASERSLLSAISCFWSVITCSKRRCHFQDLGVNYFDQPNHEKLTPYFVKRLTRLGHRITLEPCSPRPKSVQQS
jgi:transposase